MTAPVKALITPKCEFLLTRLLRGVTAKKLRDREVYKISTHTPLARRDLPLLAFPSCHPYFYSHASCEAWHRFASSRIVNFTFLLTRLLRGVTQNTGTADAKNWFLLTRLLRGVTWSTSMRLLSKKFLLTRLLRGVTKKQKMPKKRKRFLLTRLLRGVTTRYSVKF